MRSSSIVAWLCVLAVVPNAAFAQATDTSRAPRPAVLPGVTVEASPGIKPARYVNTTKFDLFYERKKTSPSGRFFEREDIEREDPQTIEDLLKKLPGVRVQRDRLGIPTISFVQCEALNLARVANSRQVTLYVDGQRASEPFETLSNMKPRDVEAMEVYRGASQLPMEARGDGCAAIFIWTRYTP
ncbi:MAG: Plug domain-containing protein [Gemmatimonadota bacterium]